MFRCFLIEQRNIESDQRSNPTKLKQAGKRNVSQPVSRQRLNRKGYLDIKSKLENKISEYIKYRDEANSIGSSTVCESIESLSQQLFIDVGSDLSAKISAGALYDSCAKG